jgi:DNA-binding beta-propeller fold protein YncE
VTDVFLVTSSLQNQLNIVDPGTKNVTPRLLGSNPNSVDYNFQTGTVVTVNSESHTASVVDFQGQGVTAVLGHVTAVLNLAGSTQFSVAIDPRSNLAVVADQNNNRVLLVPLPR